MVQVSGLNLMIMGAYDSQYNADFSSYNMYTVQCTLYRYISKYCFERAGKRRITLLTVYKIPTLRYVSHLARYAIQISCTILGQRT